MVPISFRAPRGFINNVENRSSIDFTNHTGNCMNVSIFVVILMHCICGCQVVLFLGCDDITITITAINITAAVHICVYIYEYLYRTL
jgi:hypothetical protein